MRYLIIITAFLLIPNVFFAQQTYVPDDNFEQALIDLGYDTPPLNDYVPTMRRERPPGTYNHYVSINTQVLGMLVSRVTGMNLCDYLKKNICVNVVTGDPK